MQFRIVACASLLQRCFSPKIATANSSRLGQLSKSSPRVEMSPCQRFGRRTFSNQIVDGGEAHYKPSSFQQKVLVWTKTFPSVDKIPDRISRGTMKKAMDKFRVKVSIYMIALTLVSAAVMAFIGRKARHDGQSVSRMVLERRERERNEGTN